MNSRPDSLLIDHHFNGPPGSGNGGYVCGLLAAHVTGQARVRLLAPPPLDRPLQVVAVDAGFELRDGEQRVAMAWQQDFELELLPCPALAEARAAQDRFAGFHEHAFPGCFVCGPQRASGDGLRIFPGATGVKGQVACCWTPDAALADPCGHVRPEFLWAALDCPSGWAHLHANGSPAVLGEFLARLIRPVPAGEECIALAWQIGAEGRKLHAASALFTPTGAPLACAVATWIRLREEQAQGSVQR